MSFILILLYAFAAGLLGGMGMGGGTVLIPALTLLAGVGQHAAQAANLIAFLPMSAVSLRVHAGNGLLQPHGLLPVVIPAVALSALGGIFAAYTAPDVLRRLFGAFLIALAAKQLYDMKDRLKKRK